MALDNSALKQAVGQLWKDLGLEVKKLEKEVDEASEKAAEKAEEKRVKAQADGMTTTNTGFGAELNRDELFKDELYSMIVEDSDIFQMLPGNHGQLQGDSAKVSIKGRMSEYMKKGSQGTWSDGTNKTGRNAVKTDRVSIDIAPFEDSVFISREQAHRAVMNGNFVEWVRSKIVANAQATIEAALINGDTETDTADPGNVNLHVNGTNPDTLSGEEYFLAINNGLRKLGIANGLVDTGSPAALARGTYADMLLLLGDYAENDRELLWIGNSDFGVRARNVDGYETVDKIGREFATNVNGGYLPQIEGIDFYKARHLGSSVATNGYIESGDSAANTAGQFGLLYKPAVQYAFGESMQIVPIERAKGWTLDVAMWFGYTIANEVAGLDKTVATAVYSKA